MVKKAPDQRWNLAQGGEKDFWDGYEGKELFEETKERDDWRVNFYTPIWKKFIKLDDNTKVLQIGSGPIDIINFMPFGKTYAVDPLADFYKEKFKFDYGDTEFIQSQGEELPFEEDFFDLVILSNVLDHTSSPEKVFSEISRVLKKDGILTFDCAYYQKGFLALSKIYSLFYKIFLGKIFNPYHPHMFSLKELRGLSKKYFETHRERIGENAGIRINNLKELKELRMKEKFTKKVPAHFGLLGNISYSFMGRKK